MCPLQNVLLQASSFFNFLHTTHLSAVTFHMYTSPRAHFVEPRLKSIRFPQINLGKQPNEWPRREANVPTLHIVGCTSTIKSSPDYMVEVVGR